MNACPLVPVRLCLYPYQMEKLARAQYQARRDPKDCALLYIALDRKSVLQGLMKLSRDDRDKKLVDFLARDFSVGERGRRLSALQRRLIVAHSAHGAR